MINTDALRRASMALNTAFNAEQVQAIVVAVEHLLDGYVRQVTAPPLPPEPGPLPPPGEVEDPVQFTATSKKAK